MPYWSVIKYKPKEGCENEFLKECDRLKHLDENDIHLSVILQTTDGHVVQLICKKTLDDILSTQDAGLDWLDSVDHLLEKDEEGSRTAAYSGSEVDDLRSERGVKLRFTDL